jgi:hypothetical protein
MGKCTHRVEFWSAVATPAVWPTVELHVALAEEVAPTVTTFLVDQFRGCERKGFSLGFCAKPSMFSLYLANTTSNVPLVSHYADGGENLPQCNEWPMRLALEPLAANS